MSKPRFSKNLDFSQEDKAIKQSIIFSSENEEPEVMKNFTPEVRELKVDVISQANKIMIVMQLAGVKKEDIDLIIDSDLLKIRAVQQNPVSDNNTDVSLAQECLWGEVFRPIILPKGLDTTKVVAKMELGVLTIEIPKSEEIRIKKIKIV